MFCNGCGQEVQPGQAFCSKCGKQIVGPVAVAKPLPSRVEHHVHLLGILWFALSALNAVGGLSLFILGGTLFPHLREMKGVPRDVPVGFLSSLFSTLGMIVLAKAACGFITGWGLLQRKPWGRMLALVLAFIALFNIPFGTALGVYTLWVLLPSGSQREYDALVPARAA
ncbi:MAG TPA: zinc ribbon domain-containing protein [Terriglobales bacterium]|nr:zinc ribbon domain-containing protein [Terriglobales bacterium]